MTNHTVDSLIAFSNRVKAAYLDKQIRSPVHFPSDTQAQPLIDIFKNIRPRDWVCSNWRSMWHALLKGIPEDELFDMILQGRSMYIMSKEHRFLASSIVGGMLPTACGLAMGIKRQQEELHRNGGGAVNYEWPKVWVFVGDMTATTGLFYEFKKYGGYEMPIELVIESNGLSTNANTQEIWGPKPWNKSKRAYQYDRTTPHVGLEQKVNF